MQGHNPKKENSKPHYLYSPGNGTEDRIFRITIVLIVLPDLKQSDDTSYQCEWCENEIEQR